MPPLRQSGGTIVPSLKVVFFPRLNCATVVGVKRMQTAADNLRVDSKLQDCDDG